MVNTKRSKALDVLLLLCLVSRPKISLRKSGVMDKLAVAKVKRTQSKVLNLR